MKREEAAVQKAKGKFTPPIDPIFKALPKLAAFVADAWWDDGSPRDPCTVSVNWKSGMAMVQLNDSENERCLATTAESLSDGLKALETLLEGAVLPWRYWQKKRDKKKG